MRDFCVSAPGKLLLFGEHAVVYGKTAIAVGMNLRTEVSVTLSDSDFVEIHLKDLPTVLKWSVDRLDRLCSSIPSDPLSPIACLPDCQESIREFLSPESLPANVHQSCSIFLFLYACILSKNRNFHGLKFVVQSKIPIGAGLGSSASFSVCLSAALLHVAQVFSFSTDDEVCGVYQLTDEDKDLISQWAFMAEKISHVNPSGVDNCICTYGGALRYQNGKFQPLKGSRLIKIFAVNSMISRSTKNMVKLVSDRREKYPEIIDPILDAIDKIAIKFSLHFEMDQSSGDDNFFHKNMEDLIEINQGLLNALGVSHKKLEEICAIAKEHGLCSKLTGAGGGGFSYILLPQDISVECFDKLEMDIVRKGFESWEVNVGGPGVELFDKK